MDLKEAKINTSNLDDHWYYTSKAKLVLRLIQNQDSLKVLDIGAGTGYFSKYLLRNTKIKEAYCIDPFYEDEYTSSELPKKIHYLRTIQSANCELVLLMDVLEHIDNDFELLKEYAELAPIGTIFVITVPAFQFLWSSHDVFLEHRRRYRLTQLEKLVTSANLAIIESGYYFAFIFPLAALIRLAERIRIKRKPNRSHLSRQNSLLNFVLASLCSLELKMFNLNRYFGLTAVCLAKKL